MTLNRFCNHCGKPFSTDGFYDYVCPDCQTNHYWTHRNFCILCGKKLEMMTVLRRPRGGTEKTVPYETKEGSTTCLNCRKSPASIQTKTCPACGTEFKADRGKKYCSVECRERRKTPETVIMAHRKLALQWQRGNKDKVKAQTLARYHTDKLVILYECACDVEKKHNHHPDYTKPFEVLKLCPDCHAKEHKRLRALISEAI